MHLTRSMAVYEDEEQRLRARAGTPPAAHMTSSNKPSTMGVPHTLASLLDLSICREAGWVMGWSGSTYARLLGFYQTLEASTSLLGFYQTHNHAFTAAASIHAGPDEGRSTTRTPSHAFYIVCPRPVLTCRFQPKLLSRGVDDDLLLHGFCSELVALAKKRHEIETRNGTSEAVAAFLRDNSVECTFETMSTSTTP